MYIHTYTVCISNMHAAHVKICTEYIRAYIYVWVCIILTRAQARERDKESERAIDPLLWGGYD